MSRLNVISKISGRVTTFAGEYIDSEAFQSDCGKVFEVRHGSVSLIGSLNVWDGPRSRWSRRIVPEYFSYPVPIGSVG